MYNLEQWLYSKIERFIYTRKLGLDNTWARR